jgi:hypothetical protein
MSRTLLDAETDMAARGTMQSEADRAAILRRLDRVTPDAAARWGRMDAAQMLRHSNGSLLMALGELRCAPLGKRLFQTRVVRRLIFRLPFPKSAPTAPELIARETVSFDAEQARLRSLVERFAARPAGPDAEHPLFGTLTWAEWCELQYKHLDHHFRQFGA